LATPPGVTAHIWNYLIASNHSLAFSSESAQRFTKSFPSSTYLVGSKSASKTGNVPEASYSS